MRQHILSFVSTGHNFVFVCTLELYLIYHFTQGNIFKGKQETVSFPFFFNFSFKE